MKRIKDYSYEELLERGLSRIPFGISDKGFFNLPNISASIVGGRTFVSGFKNVVEYLNRDVKHIISFISKELGAACDIEGDKLILHGRYNSSSITSALMKYAKKYVICPVCSSKDTYLMKERRVLILVCTACGARSSIGG
ncbi:MAG: translation initiation factor IF-2 subunit beta [Candidatus Methanomethylicia archaeon]|nr:translation initiation factor IF-2 subunit beta [Candidatus Methanomethylicia archaeon]